MDIYGKIKPQGQNFNITSFQETFEALLRELFADIGIVSIGKGFQSESHTAELYLDAADLVDETTKAIGDALQELFGVPFSFSYSGTEMLVEQDGFTAKLDAFVAQRLEWRVEAAASEQRRAQSYGEPSDTESDAYVDTEEWRNIYGPDGLITDRIMAD